MREVLRSNDAVLINFAQSVLRDAGIASFLADQHMSVVEGSIGVFPRRLLVSGEDWAAAHQALDAAGLGEWLIHGGETSA
jgi:hypothetical protein